MNPPIVVYLLFYGISLGIFYRNRNNQFVTANNFMFAVVNSFFLAELIFRLSQIMRSPWEKWTYISTISRLYGDFLYPKLLLMLAALFLPLLYFKASIRVNHHFQLWLAVILSINILSEIFMLYLNDWTVIVPGWNTPNFYGLGYGGYPISCYALCLFITLGGSLWIMHSKHNFLNHEEIK